MRFSPFRLRFAIVQAAHAESSHTHTLSFSLSFLSFPSSTAVERLTIAARFNVCSIARSRVDVLWFYPLSHLPYSNSRVDFRPRIYHLENSQCLPYTIEEVRLWALHQHC